MTNGVYSLISRIISVKESRNKTVISTGDIINTVLNSQEINDISKEELMESYASSAAASVLNNRGYYSPMHGYGYYVNPERLKEPVIIDMIMENKGDDLVADETIIKALQDMKVASLSEHGQMAFDEDMNIHEELTKRKVLEFLEKESR